MRWILLSTLAFSLARAQNPAAEELVKAYVTAFNAGEAAMQKYFEQHAVAETPVAVRLERYRSLKAEMGTLTLRKLSAGSPREIAADMANSQGTANFQFSFSAGDPPKLQGIRVRIGGPGGGDEPSGPALPPRPEAAALQEIQAAVARAVAADQFSGSVRIEREGRLVWESAHGEADKAAKKPNTVETRFNVGSIIKSFTQVAVAQLVAAGKLQLDDPVGKYLPEYPNAEVRSRVTIRQLLDMRSGVGDIFGARYDATPKSKLRALADFVPLFSGEPLAFEPGTSSRYSNGGYILLGLIIEKASGMDYYEYIRKHVFGPAGMRDSGFFFRSEQVPERAKGYAAAGGVRKENFDTLPERGSSAGGGYATAPDLLRYARALATEKLISREAMGKIGRGLRGMGIAGGAPGLNAALETDVNGYDLAVMANYDPPAATKLAQEIRRILQAVKH